MPIDTFMAYSGTYPSVEDALADYDAVHELHTDVRLIDAYDAAVVERKADGKVKIVKKHETPTRVGGVAGAGVGLATGLAIALFPAAAIGGDPSRHWRRRCGARCFGGPCRCRHEPQ